MAKWEVVGGADKGGILVRAGKATDSAQEPERLSTGAVVKELSNEGGRLQYELVTGTGPTTGWVSIRLKDKELLTKVSESAPTPVAEAASDTQATPEGFYALSATTIDSEKLSLSALANRVVYAINVASCWGMTTREYNVMKMLMKNFENDLSLLLFPSGQFGDQEFKTAKEIKDFVVSKGLQGPNVHVLAKCDVKGPNTDPVWQFLKEQTSAPDPQWNFTGKFLVAKDGSVSIPTGNIRGDVDKLVA